MSASPVQEIPRPAAVAPSVVLVRKIAAVRRKDSWIRIATGLAWAVMVASGMVAAGMFLDWWFELPLGVRAAFLAANALALGWIAVRFIARPWLRPPDDDTIALRVERAFPALRSRLISAIQLTRAPAPGAETGCSRALVQALVDDTEAFSMAVSFGQVAGTRRLRRLLAAGAVTVLATLALYLSGGATTRDLLRRVFLSNTPVPRKTGVVQATGNRIVGRGDSVELAATAQGIIPRSGRVMLRHSSGRAQSFSLEPMTNNRVRFRRGIDQVADSFSYRIQLNDGVSDEFQVRVVPRPAIADLEATQTFPAYTGLGPVQRALGDLALLAGSRLEVRAVASKEIAGAQLRLAGLERGLPVAIDAADRRRLSASLDIPTNRLTGFGFELTDDLGVASKDSAVYRIEIVADRPPSVRVIYPQRKEELVTERGQLLIVFEAVDDFAIGDIRLRHKLGAAETNTVRELELELGDQTAPKSFRRRFEWRLEEFQPPLTEGDLLEYWIEVRDRNDATGPGVGTSDHFLVKVVSEAEKRADLLNRVGDALGSIGDVAQDQEKLTQVLGELILEKGP